MSDTPDTQVLVDTAIAAAKPEPLDRGQLVSVTVPDGASHELHDLEKYEDAPRRMRGTVRPQTVDDLVRYTQRHDTQTATTLWVDEDTAQVVTVINDHDQEAAGWGDHRALLKLRPTPEWQRWAALDGKLVDQEAFAEHIELGLPEIVDPDSATMLEIAQSIEGTKSADFQAGHRLDSGAVAIGYVETVAARAGQRGELDIPSRFKLAIAPFLGEEPTELWARFRYRIRGEKLALGYLLERPELVVRDTIDRIGDRLARQFGEERVFVGTPREPRT